MLMVCNFQIFQPIQDSKDDYVDNHTFWDNFNHL